jgi:AmmeMemoRadiSam system protein A
VLVKNVVEVMKMKPNVLFHPTAEKQTAQRAGQLLDAGVVCAVLMPHAPILVPGVGGDRGGAAAASRRAMRAAAKSVMSHRPETLMLISPHSPRRPQAFGLWADDLLQGSFAELDAPQVEMSLPLDRPLAEAIVVEMHARGLETWMIRHCPLDHGAMVPLWFLAEAGWTGPTVILGLNHSRDGGLTALGEAVATAAQSLPRRLAIIASGDMSHRLTANAPCGFHPLAHQFDETFIHLVRAGDYRKLEKIAPELRELAAEDAVDSTLIAASAANWQTTGHQVLNYEGRFGVGYGVAVLFAEKTHSSGAEPADPAAGKSDGTMLPGLARRSVETALRGSFEQSPSLAGKYLSAARGVFVTIRTREGKLRGCVGTLEPVCPNVVAETWRSARLAALQDKRFAPVTVEEMAGLRFEVSVLHSREEVTLENELDPRRYGVVVSTSDRRSSLLLPGIKEIRTPEQQLRLARKKGWISPDESIMIQRFQTDHFEELD